MRARLLISLLLVSGLFLYLFPAGALVTVDAPPQITLLAPAGVDAGTGAFTLNVSGTGFLPAPVIEWNGTPLLTDIVSETVVSAVVPAEYTRSPGSAAITVSRGDGVSRSALVTFLIAPAPNPAPRIQSVSPGSLLVGSRDQVLLVNGSGFIRESEFLWNGHPCEIKGEDFSSLSVVIPAAYLKNEGSAWVQVQNPGPGGGSSDVVRVIILPLQGELPVITRISPLTVAAGGPSFTLEVTGGYFTNGTVCLWNETTLKTKVIDQGHIQTIVPAGLFPNPGTGLIQVFVPKKGLSAPFVMPVSVHQDPAPVFANMTPVSVPVGSDGFTLTVNGEGFTENTVLLWNAEARSTRFKSPGRLFAAIPASDLALPGTVTITLLNPPPGGGTSAGLGFQIIGSQTAAVAGVDTVNASVSQVNTSVPMENLGGVSVPVSSLDPFNNEYVEEDSGSAYLDTPAGAISVNPFAQSEEDDEFVAMPSSGIIHLDPFVESEEL